MSAFVFKGLKAKKQKDGTHTQQLSSNALNNISVMHIVYCIVYVPTFYGSINVHKFKCIYIVIGVTSGFVSV